MSEGRPSVDLDAYASRYKGRMKIMRLRFIARKSKDLELDALSMAIDEAKKGKNTFLYKELIAQADGRLGPAYALDEAWVTECDQWATKELEKLRHELEDCRQQQNKEVIRTGHTDLGDFFHARGKLQQAHGEYMKTRDYCMHAHHNVQMCLKVIKVSIEAGDFSNVENYHVMAENTPNVETTSTDLAKTRACAGLALLVRGRYADAAHRFLTTNMDASEEKTAKLQEQFGDVLSLEDIATLGGLCALATLGRPFLKKQVIDKVEFRNLLELVPDVRELIRDFYDTRYTRCLDTLERLRPDLMLDMYLGRDDHVDRLYQMIRQKALVQYVSPFLTADLRRMEAVFKTSTAKLENELYALIEAGSIQARIDTQKKALYRKQTNRHWNALSRALQSGQEAFDDAEAMLLRMSLIKNDLQLSMPSSQHSGNTLGPRGSSVNSVSDSMFERSGGAG